MKVKVLSDMDENMEYVIEVDGVKRKICMDGCGGNCEEERECLGSKLCEVKGSVVGMEFELEEVCWVEKDMKDCEWGLKLKWLREKGKC